MTTSANESPKSFLRSGHLPTLIAALQTRDQKRLDLLKVNVASGSSQVLFTETSPNWVELHSDLHFLERQTGTSQRFFFGAMGQFGEGLRQLLSGLGAYAAAPGRQ